MKSYEKESLLKSFLLFFSVQLIFLSIVLYQHYHKVLHEYDMHIGNKIMQCHLNAECKDFESTAVKNIGQRKLHTLYTESEVYMLFRKKNSYMKMQTSKKIYYQKQAEIKKHVFIEYALYLIVLVLESFLFALYALRPLKKALLLNEEFVKDILHDFNTPLSALKINLKILKKKFGNDDALERSDEAIRSILSLQENLHYYLSQSKLQNEKIDLSELIKERGEYFQALFPSLKITVNVQKTVINANKDVISRIIDNLISNACKYNKKEGEVKLSLRDKILIIEDSGIGINNPQKIFQRHYKEQSRGIGIGLHIVKKLCDELNILLKVQSVVDVGSSFSLDFSHYKGEKV